MNRKSFVSAVIVAAGSATRMNTDKIILPLSGVPCICRTMLAFEEASTVGEIIVVTRSAMQKKHSKILQQELSDQTMKMQLQNIFLMNIKKHHKKIVPHKNSMKIKVPC